MTAPNNRVMLTAQDRSILQVKYRQAQRRWQRLNLDSIFQSLGFLFLLGLFWSFCFFSVTRLCENLYNKDVVGPIILFRISSFGFFAAFIIVVGGHILTAYASLFRGRELTTLIRTPYPLNRLFHVQCVETLIAGGWVSVMFCLPILLAYGWQLNASGWYYPLIILGLLGFILLAGLVGTLIMLLIARFILGRPWRTAISSLVVIIGFVALIAYIGMNSNVLLTQVNPNIVGEALANLQLSSNPYLPSHWIAQLMISARVNDYYDTALYLLLLWSSAMFLWVVLRELGDRWYLNAWFWSQENVHFLNSRRDRKFRPRRFWLSTLLPRPTASIIHKEFQVFKRDFSQWGQLVLIITLVLFYVAHTQNIIFDENAESSRQWLVFINVILLGFIQATLSLRFTYPSISLEGKAYWTVATSSVGCQRFYFSKYYLHALVMLIIGEGMGIMLNQILGVDASLNLISLFVLFLFSFGFTSWSMGFGVAFRKFEATHAADVTSDTGALVAMIVILIYFGISISIFSRFALEHTPGVDLVRQFSLKPELIIWAAIFLLLQTSAILFPAAYGLRQLERTEL